MTFQQLPTGFGFLFINAATYNYSLCSIPSAQKNKVEATSKPSWLEYLNIVVKEESWRTMHCRLCYN